MDEARRPFPRRIGETFEREPTPDLAVRNNFERTRDQTARGRISPRTADRGGSNGARVKLWKRELQRLVNEAGLDVTVNHLPPGTSSGTKSSIACSPSSPRTAAVSRW
jgi:hypothetical protein